MTSHTHVDVKRSSQSKSYSAFNSLPTLRGKDRRDADKSPSRKFKRPPQLADQLLFPGRRLDRLHRSTYSGYSGRSLEIESIISGGNNGGPGGAGGRLNSADVTNLGSSKPGLHHTHGFSQSLNDVTNQPWEAFRQLPSAHSHLSLFSRQGSKLLSTAGSARPRGLVNTIAGASASTGNLNSSSHEFSAANGKPVPSNRWQFSGGYRQNTDFFAGKMVRDSTSPDSSYSSESTSEPEWPGPPPAVVVPNIALPVSRVSRVNGVSRQPSNASMTRQRSKTPPRRQSDNTNTSSTPQLDKILWALVPDEFANISDTGVSDLEPISSRYVTVTDLEAGDLDGQGEKGVAVATARRPPPTPRRPILTQETLSRFGASVPSDDRVLNWLADCDSHTLSTSLPTHLPDISYTFRLGNQNISRES